MNLQKIRRTAAEILAAAVYETFPEVKLLGGSQTHSGFYYDFYFPHEIHPELHLQIEEKMRQIVREKREIRDLEMVGVSAKAFLKSRGHFERAKQVDGNHLFPILQMGSFADLSSGAHLKNTAELNYFKLFPPILLEGKAIRLMGSAFDEKEKLKEFLKKWNHYSKKRHEKEGETRHFWLEAQEGMVWLPEGLKALRNLLEVFKGNLPPGSCEVRTPLGIDLAQMHKNLLADLRMETIFEIRSEEKVFEGVEEVGLLDPCERSELWIATSLKNVISSLQSIGKTLTILGFSYGICLTKSRRQAKKGVFLREALEELGWAFEENEEEGETSQVDFLVPDGLGRFWSAAAVQAKECLNVQVILERNLALLLEL